MTSAWKIISSTLMVIIISGAVKAHFHIIRLALLAALGLLGLYLLRKLSQDWNRIMASWGGGGNGGGGNRPRLTSVLGSVTRFFRISKRSVDSTSMLSDKPSELNKSKSKSRRRYNENVPQLRKILKFDESKCARKFICYLSTKAPADLTWSEYSILNFIQSSGYVNNLENNYTEDGFLAFKAAADIGKLHHNSTICSNMFKPCLFNNNQLSIINSKI